jgi:hypothetical protein
MKIEIKHEGPSIETVVLVDGENIAGSLTGLSVSIGASQAATVNLELFIGDISILLTDPKVVVDESTINTLKLLGWTPPVQDKTKSVQDSYTCPFCNMTSNNPHDVEASYCGNCYRYGID